MLGPLEVRTDGDAHRLITLTGPGGAGKTRLAVEAARAELGAMPDGVWLVGLAPVTDPGDVISTVLSTLGLREQSLLNARRPTALWSADPPDEEADALGRLLAALARQRTLLVLDNCDHLVAAAAALADRVLAACPQVRIMATSREPLNITGEALWTVGPLTLPPDPAATSLSCAVRAQEAEYRAGADSEVDPVQRDRIAEPLDQPFGKYRVRHAAGLRPRPDRSPRPR